MKFFLISIAIMASIFANGQSTPAEFASFAQKQNNLFVEAYKIKNVEQYNILLTEFIKKYEGLTKDQQKEFAPYLAAAYYNFSCTYSLLNKKQLALNYLDKAIKAGFANYANIKRDTDFDNIKNETAFKTLIQPLRELGDYPFILKKDNRFGGIDSTPIPSFTYQNSDHPGLKDLRKQFKLDSIAGAGNEVSKFINILHWVHNTIPHDGQHESGITSINGFEITSVATNKNIGVSCGELATVLNDCYLAMGFKSRKIYCMPKDSLGIDYDSHVINVVYSSTLKKWLWMDPTNDAYVMNEKGELLSIEEVRSRLIQNQPMIINPDANWNHKMSTVKDDYLYNYMAKNLYRFYTPLESKYDVETRGQEKTVTYVNLVPLGYGKFSKQPGKQEFYNSKLKTTFIHYTTHNSSSFWQVPD